MLRRTVVLSLASLMLSACESTSPPTCLPDAGECAQARDGSALGDVEAPSPDASTIDFDSGTSSGSATCKGQLELCSVPSDCCTPYACTNGTCR